MQPEVSVEALVEIVVGGGLSDLFSFCFMHGSAYYRCMSEAV